MNKEDYVSLEVAKLMKEKGYDEPCETEVNIYLGTWAYCDYDHVGARNSNLPTNKASYPTLYEAQKWLRNNHNIHIVIDNYACGYAWFLYKADNGTRISEYAEDGPNDGGCWDTYEEALNAGILEALKII